jgi:hypothetical protein
MGFWLLVATVFRRAVPWFGLASLTFIKPCSLLFSPSLLQIFQFLAAQRTYCHVEGITLVDHLSCISLSTPLPLSLTLIISLSLCFALLATSARYDIYGIDTSNASNASHCLSSLSFRLQQDSRSCLVPSSYLVCTTSFYEEVVSLF